MGKRIFIIVLTILVLVFSGCSKKASTSGTKADMTNSTGTAAPQQSKGASGTYNDTAAPAKAPSAEVNQVNTSAADYDRKVIYNANVTLEVKDLNAAYKAIAEKTDGMGGYVSGSNLSQYSSQVTAKIPAARLNEFLSFLDSVGEKKDSSTSTSDITDQYTDADSRVKNLKAQEEQLLTIMKKASTIDEILKVQNELSRVRGEIEVLQGKLNMWDKLVEMSTVVIRISKVQEIGGKEVRPKFISFGEIGRGISNGFTATLNFVIRFISGLFIFIISAIPVMPFVALIVWIVFRYRKKLKKNIGK